MNTPNEEPKIDCHVHVFDPARFPYAADAWYLPAAAEAGTPDCGPLLTLLEQLLPDAAARHAVLWDTPKRLFDFGD